MPVEISCESALKICRYKDIPHLLLLFHLVRNLDWFDLSGVSDQNQFVCLSKDLLKELIRKSDIALESQERVRILGSLFMFPKACVGLSLTHYFFPLIPPKNGGVCYLSLLFKQLTQPMGFFFPSKEKLVCKFISVLLWANEIFQIPFRLFSVSLLKAISSGFRREFH